MIEKCHVALFRTSDDGNVSGPMIISLEKNKPLIIGRQHAYDSVDFNTPLMSRSHLQLVWQDEIIAERCGQNPCFLYRKGGLMNVNENIHESKESLLQRSLAASAKYRLEDGDEIVLAKSNEFIWWCRIRIKKMKENDEIDSIGISKSSEREVDEFEDELENESLKSSIYNPSESDVSHCESPLIGKETYSDEEARWARI